MTNEKDNKISTENVRWDLTNLYSDIDDPKLDQDVARYIELAKRFNVDHKGKLAQNLGQAILDWSEIAMLEGKIGLYLYLKESLDVTDSKVKAKLAEVDRVTSHAAGEYLTFLNIELVGLGDDVLGELYSSNETVVRHKPWIEHARIFKPHILSEPVESALTKRSPFGSNAWGQFFDEVESDLEFEYKNEKKNITEMFHVLSDSKDQEERALVLEMINDKLKGIFSKYSAQTLYMVTGSKAVEGIERLYRHPMEMMNKSNQVTDEVVDALHRAVIDEGGPLAQRYYRLKAKLLGVPVLKWSDRNAPMPFTDTTKVPFEEGMAMVQEAYQSFSPTLMEIIDRMVRENKIDAPVYKNRRSGAYNYSVVLPGINPASFIFLNYLGSSRDVMTLAHELGHGVHGILAGKTQGPLMYHAPIAYCETASVFGEMTTFNFLKKQLSEKGDTKSLLALIMGKIDDVINTVVRQIAFSNFERRIHGMDKEYKNWGEPKKLSVEELNQVWLETTKQLYGQDGEVFTYENADHLWSCVGHFHRPFYVYGYAFGQLLTQGIYAQQARLGEKFESLYLDMLSSGMTRNVVQLLEPFGLDPSDEKFWLDGIRAGLGEMVKEAEELSNHL